MVDAPRAPGNQLLCSQLTTLVQCLRSTTCETEADEYWRQMEEAIDAVGLGDDPVVATPILAQDLEALCDMLRRWRRGNAPQCHWDEQVLQRALRAFLRKQRRAGMRPVKPLNTYPRDVWKTLLARSLLVDVGAGLLDLPRARRPGV